MIFRINFNFQSDYHDLEILKITGRDELSDYNNSLLRHDSAKK